MMMKEKVAMAVIEAAMDEIVELLECGITPREECVKNTVDVNLDEVICEVAKRVGLPICLVDRTIDTMFKVLLEIGCNGIEFGEVDEDEE